jgi:RNA polymerase sigma-70 factor (ECF subfamily)
MKCVPLPQRAGESPRDEQESLARVTAAADINALIARAQQGEARAFEQLIASHLGLVRRYARAFASLEAEADDLAQDALLKVYRSLRLFQCQSAFSTWLYTVVRSVYLDAVKNRSARERARERVLGSWDTAQEPTAPAADELLGREEDRHRVWQALRQVPLEFRTALVLFDIEGRSYEDIAAIEGVPIGTIKSRLSRGRSHLKRLLGAPEAANGPNLAGVEATSPGTDGRVASSHLIGGK